MLVFRSTETADDSQLKNRKLKNSTRNSVLFILTDILKSLSQWNIFSDVLTLDNLSSDVQFLKCRFQFCILLNVSIKQGATDTAYYVVSVDSCRGVCPLPVSATVHGICLVD